MYENIRWISLHDDQLSSSDDDAEKRGSDAMEILPLYPLPAVYLPTKNVNHTLNNVEPQNIQMAQDLMMTPSSYKTANETNGWCGCRRFCAVLRSMDKGQIASVGTILYILEAEEQTQYGSDDVARIRLTCRAEGLVEIAQIMNPDAFSRERRLRRSKEYLQARVRPISVANNDRPSEENASICDASITMLHDLQRDFRLIKTMYQLELGADDFPPGMLSRLGDAIQVEDLSLPADGKYETSRDDKIDSLHWNLAQEWQSICMTLRQGQQALLATERNERMIDAATAKGGPLKLPIHMGDLEPEARMGIQLLEDEAQTKHVLMGMDAILDFQVLISVSSMYDRIKWLALLISRERKRLEDIAFNR